MTPEAALEAQIELYRQMTGEERLAIACQLHELSCNVAREGIRAQFSGYQRTGGGTSADRTLEDGLRDMMLELHFQVCSVVANGRVVTGRNAVGVYCFGAKSK